MKALAISTVAAAALLLATCGRDSGLVLPAGQSPAPPAGYVLVARLAQISDTHVVDIESPARFCGAESVIHTAWRPQEAYSTQIIDGIIRTVNRVHASGRMVDFLLHTGDCTDNCQSNELSWFVGLMDGTPITPLSGPDDRLPEDRPAPQLDPFATFTPQGLYQQGRHGPLLSIPWYGVFGNHDAYALGVFPWFEGPDGHRTSPLPLPGRPGEFLPVVLDPVGSVAYGAVSPAFPGPPPLLNRPVFVESNPARAYHSKDEFGAALAATATGPAGHGLTGAASGQSWYSVSPLPGLRLIGLDTTTARGLIPGFVYSEGALSRAQLQFLKDELDAATARGELVIVATHHPTETLTALAGSEVEGPEFRAVLAAYPAVVLHLAGHTHRNHVTRWGADANSTASQNSGATGGYLEIETCATIDLPQEGRLLEIWKNPADGSVAIEYEMFSHLNDSLPPLGDDPLRGMREVARQLAMGNKPVAEQRYGPGGSGQLPAIDMSNPAGAAEDRSGVVVLSR